MTTCSSEIPKNPWDKGWNGYESEPKYIFEIKAISASNLTWHKGKQKGTKNLSFQST